MEERWRWRRDGGEVRWRRGEGGERWRRCGGRPDTIKLLEENIGGTVFDINHSMIFFDPPPRVMKIKTKINKWDLMKLQSFCTAKETINKMKRQLSEWEKIFANETTDKGLISKIYKQLMQLNIKKTNNPEIWCIVMTRAMEHCDDKCHGAL